MASKLGGAQPLGGSTEPRASLSGHWLETTPTAIGNSQSNPRRSNPPGGAARSRSALRLWGTRLGLVPHDASRSAAGFQLLTCSNDAEPRTPWLRSAPHVGGDRRTTGRLHAINCLADSASVVVASTFKGPVCARGGSNSVFSTRVRASAVVRYGGANTGHDDHGGAYRLIRCWNVREEGRCVLGRRRPTTFRKRCARAGHTDQADAAIRSTCTQPHSRRRGLAGVGACLHSQYAARVGHQAAPNSAITAFSLRMVLV